MVVRFVCYLVVVLCIFYNICELRKDDFLEEWFEDVYNVVDNILLIN